MIDLPTSDINSFKQQLENANIPVTTGNKQKNKISKIQKNIVLSFASDSTGCGHIRNIFPLSYLNAIHGKTGRYNLIMSPAAFIWQDDILMKTRSIFFQRTMSPNQLLPIKKFRQLKSKYNYKMIYDIDDFIWKGPNEGECIPKYNFGSTKIGDDVRVSSIQIMNEMDLVCVSTQFLKDYLSTHGVEKPIQVVDNVVPKFFWGNKRKRPIKNKIEKPKIVITASPTHYCNQRKLLGDFDTAWREWIIKNVKENKIELFCMGGLPFFFDSIKNKIKKIGWVNSFAYHTPIKDWRPDFCIGTLIPNYFNYAKSNLKFIESCAYGAVFIGNVWKGTKYEKYPSPYDCCPLQVPYNIDIKELDELFWKYTYPENYNKILDDQYSFMLKNGLYMESQRYTNLISSIF